MRGLLEAMKNSVRASVACVLAASNRRISFRSGGARTSAGPLVSSFTGFGIVLMNGLAAGRGGAVYGASASSLREADCDESRPTRILYDAIRRFSLLRW